MDHADLDLSVFDVLSFDCYGTLVDWETGLLRSLRPLLGAAGDGVDDDRLLARYAHHEARLEAAPFRPYRAVLDGVARAIGSELGVAVDDASAARFAESLGDWPAFPDTVAALRRLARRYRLAIISNVDDDLFAVTARTLEVPFEPVVTARQVGAYKPSPAMFTAAAERIGVPRDRWLHIAQSRVHDVVPAHAFGIATVWVDRRAGRGGGAAGEVAPGSARPDLTVPDLAALATRAGL